MTTTTTTTGGSSSTADRFMRGSSSSKRQKRKRIVFRVMTLTSLTVLLTRQVQLVQDWLPPLENVFLLSLPSVQRLPDEQQIMTTATTTAQTSSLPFWLRERRTPSSPRDKELLLYTRQSLQAVAGQSTPATIPAEYNGRLEPLWTCSSPSSSSSLSHVSENEGPSVSSTQSSNRALPTVMIASHSNNSSSSSVDTNDWQPPPLPSSHPRDRKLIFVHVFKTAGSSFRSFFLDAYGAACGKSTSIVTECSYVTVDSLLPNGNGNANAHANASTPWYNDPAAERYADIAARKLTNTTTTTTTTTEAVPTKHHHYCVHKESRNRQGQRMRISSSSSSSSSPPPPPPLTTSFVQEQVDILIGHLPLGVHEHWSSSSGQDASSTVAALSSSSAPAAAFPQYVAFFREPVTKYVSGRLFSHKNEQWTMEQAITSIQTLVWERLARNEYYNGYAQYLLTPLQKQELLLHYNNDNNNNTGNAMEEQAEQQYQKHVVQLIQQNLVKSNALIGIVELMGDSLALLQSVLDGNLERTHEFQKLNVGVTDDRRSSTQRRRHRRRRRLLPLVSKDFITRTTRRFLRMDIHATTSHDSIRSVIGTTTNDKDKDDNDEDEDEENITPASLLRKNRSHLSSSAIVEQLQNDEEFYPLLLEYLRYELEVYDYALQLHMRQVEWMHQQYGDRFDSFQ